MSTNFGAIVIISLFVLLVYFIYKTFVDDLTDFDVIGGTLIIMGAAFLLGLAGKAVWEQYAKRRVRARVAGKKRGAKKVVTSMREL